MISKELIFGGYVKTDNKELLKLFLMECLKHDNVKLPMVTESTHNKWRYFAISESMTPCGHGISAVDDKKELTLDDFKPETKVEYVKCEFDKLSDLVTSVENGDSYYSNTHGDGFYKSELYSLVALYKHDDPIYRKVEKEVDWHTEAIEFVDKSSCIILNDTINFMLTKPNGETIDEYDNEVLELCRVILRANGEVK